MAPWLQHLLVLLIIAGSVAFVVRQMVRTFQMKKSKLGACCAKGCAHDGPQDHPTQAPAGRVQFLPVESLARRR